MERQLGRYLTGVILEVLCFIALGALILTPQVLDPSTTGFTFTIFGVCAVLTFNALQFEPRKTFGFAAAVATLVGFIMMLRNPTAAFFIRNLLWFLFIIGGAYLTNKIVRHPSWGNPSVLGLVMWTASFALIYLAMTFVDIFVFGFYPTGFQYEGMHIGAAWYFGRAIVIGGVLGFGIGVGFVLSGIIEKLSSPAHAA